MTGARCWVEVNGEPLRGLILDRRASCHGQIVLVIQMDHRFMAGDGEFYGRLLVPETQVNLLVN